MQACCNLEEKVSRGVLQSQMVVDRLSAATCSATSQIRPGWVVSSGKGVTEVSELENSKAHLAQQYYRQVKRRISIAARRHRFERRMVLGGSSAVVTLVVLVRNSVGWALMLGDLGHHLRSNLPRQVQIRTRHPNAKGS